MRYFFLVSYLILLCYAPTTMAQFIKVEGFVRDSTGMPIVGVQVVAQKDSVNFLAFSSTNEKGFYALNIKQDVSVFYLYARMLGFKKQRKQINREGVLQTIFQVDFVLQEDILGNQQFEIVAQAYPIIVKGDTTIYKANAFKTGSERVVEDVLQKLPGIHVAEDGTISFNGKKVTKVLMEGDDLLGPNYTKGTKTINARVIDQIHVIQNYSDNKVLGSIIKSDETVLDLKVEENFKGNVSGDALAGYGYSKHYNVNVNMFALFKKNKLFTMSALNNIGDVTLSNAASGGGTISEASALTGVMHFAELAIPALSIPEKQYRFNQFKTVNGNYIHRFNKLWDINATINASSDHAYKDHISTEKYLFDLSNPIVYYSNTRLNQSPKWYDIGATLHYAGLKQDFKYYGQFGRSTQQVDRAGMYNSETMQTERLDLNDYGWAQNGVLTTKFKESIILRFFMAQQSTSSKETYRLQQNSIVPASQLANSHEKRTLIGGDLVISPKTNFKHIIRIQGIRENAELFTHLEHLGYFDVNPVLENTSSWQYQELEGSYQNILSHNKWEFQNNLQIRQLYINAYNSQNLTHKKWVLLPRANVNYHLNKTQSLRLGWALNVKKPTLPEYTTSYYLNDYQNLLRYQNSPTGIKYQSISATFISLDPLANRSGLLYLLYNKNEQSLISTLESTGKNFYNTLYYGEGNESFIIGGNYDRYVPGLRLLCKIEPSVSWNTSNNRLNTLALRQNEYTSARVKFLISKGFKDKLFLKSYIQPNISHVKNNQITQQHVSLKTNFNILLNPVKFISINSNINYFNPNTKNKMNKHILFDTQIRIRPPQNKDWNIGITLNNILNEKYYSIYTISDFYTHESTYTLQPRQILIEISYQF